MFLQIFVSLNVGLVLQPLSKWSEPWNIYSTALKHSSSLSIYCCIILKTTLHYPSNSPSPCVSLDHFMLKVVQSICHIINSMTNMGLRTILLLPSSMRALYLSCDSFHQSFHPFSASCFHKSANIQCGGPFTRLPFLLWLVFHSPLYLLSPFASLPSTCIGNEEYDNGDDDNDIYLIAPVQKDCFLGSDNGFLRQSFYKMHFVQLRFIGAMAFCIMNLGNI